MTRRISLLLLALVVAGSAWAGTWRSISPDGGSIYALAAAPGAGNIVYAVSTQGSVLRSSDGALSWSSRVDRLGGWPQKLSVDPINPDLLYAGTLSGLLRSADGGKTWSRLLEGRIWMFSIAPSDPRVLYAARDYEVLRSDDAGASWTIVRASRWSTEELAVGPADSRLVYAAGQDGFFRSEDGGNTWVEIGDEVPDLMRIRALAVDPRQPSTLYAGEWSGRILKSDDRGAAWSLLWEGPGPSSLLQTLALDPVTGLIYGAFGQNGIFRSTDGGASWTHVFSGGLALDVHAGTPRLYVGTLEGIHLSEDAGQSWRLANQGIREIAFTRVAADPHAPGLIFAVADPEASGPFGATRRIVYKSTDGGNSWTSPFGSPYESPYVSDLDADPSRPGTWFLACADGVWKTPDGGATWERASQGLLLPEFVATLELAPSDPDMLYALGWGTYPVCNFERCADIRVYRSQDAAAQWQPSRVQGLERERFLLSLAVDPADASTVYAAGAGLFRSKDGGRSWRKLGGGLGNAVVQIVADPFRSGTLYSIAAVKQGLRVFKSMDHGATWAVAAKGLPHRAFVWELAADPTAPGTLYAATTLGVYVTRNGGKLWTAMNAGMGNRPVFTVAVDPLQPDTLYAGREDGLFRFSDESP